MKCCGFFWCSRPIKAYQNAFRLAGWSLLVTTPWRRAIWQKSKVQRLFIEIGRHIHIHEYKCTTISDDKVSRLYMYSHHVNKPVLAWYCRTLNFEQLINFLINKYEYQLILITFTNKQLACNTTTCTQQAHTFIVRFIYVSFFNHFDWLFSIEDYNHPTHFYVSQGWT